MVFTESKYKKRGICFACIFLSFCCILTLIQSKDRKNYEVYDEKKFRTKKPKMTYKKYKKPKMTRFPEKFGLLVDLTECVLCVEIKIKSEKFFNYDQKKKVQLLESSET